LYSNVLFIFFTTLQIILQFFVVNNLFELGNYFAYYQALQVLLTFGFNSYLA